MPIAVVRDGGAKSSSFAQNARSFRADQMKRPVRVLLIGAAGRMGKTIVDLAKDDPKIDIAARCDLGDSIQSAMQNCNVAIDFSQAEAIAEICRVALEYSKPLVIGTTGQSKEQG